MALATVVGGMAIAATAAPANAAGVLGPINITQQCKVQYGSSYTAIVLNTSNPYSWRCAYSGYQYGVNLDAGCVNQYGAGAFSLLEDPNNAYSWRCAR